MPFFFSSQSMFSSLSRVAAFSWRVVPPFSNRLAELQAQPLPHNIPLPLVSPVFSKARLHVIGLFEKQFLSHQLSVFHGNVTAAAKASKMTRQNFQRLMKKYGVESSAFKPHPK